MGIVDDYPAIFEFIMVYGWAILVVVVAVGALAYFGLLSPNNILPQCVDDCNIVNENIIMYTIQCYKMQRIDGNCQSIKGIGENNGST